MSYMIYYYYLEDRRRCRRCGWLYFSIAALISKKVFANRRPERNNTATRTPRESQTLFDSPRNRNITGFFIASTASVVFIPVRLEIYAGCLESLKLA